MRSEVHIRGQTVLLFTTRSFPAEKSILRLREGSNVTTDKLFPAKRQRGSQFTVPG